jgi:hypothetical protein
MIRAVFPADCTMGADCYAITKPPSHKPYLSGTYGSTQAMFSNSGFMGCFRRHHLIYHVGMLMKLFHPGYELFQYVLGEGAEQENMASKPNVNNIADFSLCGQRRALFCRRAAAPDLSHKSLLSANIE